nr:leucine-rich repeat extensin-like protein 5 [Lolium perenne]
MLPPVKRLSPTPQGCRATRPTSPLCKPTSPLQKHHAHASIPSSSSSTPAEPAPRPWVLDQLTKAAPPRLAWPLPPIPLTFRSPRPSSARSRQEPLLPRPGHHTAASGASVSPPTAPARLPPYTGAASWPPLPSPPSEPPRLGHPLLHLALLNSPPIQQQLHLRVAPPQLPLHAQAST